MEFRILHMKFRTLHIEFRTLHIHPQAHSSRKATSFKGCRVIHKHLNVFKWFLNKNLKGVGAKAGFAAACFQ